MFLINKKTPLEAPVLLDKSHLVDEFDCGDQALNDYIKRFAYVNNQNSSSRTYVTTRGPRVAGYYTLAPGAVTREEVPSRVAKGLARHPVPVIILARLAVDQFEQGSNIGKGLLSNALLRIVQAADIIGGRAVLVHAKNHRVKSFYQKFGFTSSPIDQYHLYLLLKDVKQTLRRKDSPPVLDELVQPDTPPFSCCR